MFSEAYGIQFSPEHPSDAYVLADEKYINWYGAVYGGCFLALAFASAREAAGRDAHGTFFTGRFIRGAQIGSNLTASTTIDKDGRRFLNCTTTVKLDGKAAFILTSDFLKKPEYLKQERMHFNSGCRPPAPCNLILNSKDNPSSMPGETFQSMFVAMSQRVRAENLELNGEASVGMYTDECFSDGQGFIDSAVFALLTDDAAGVASWSLLSDNVSTNMSMSLFKKAPVGSFVSCKARVRWMTDRLSLVAGEFWADETLVGCCEATFFKEKEW